VGFDALDVTEFDHQLIEGQVAFFLDPAPDPICHASQCTMSFTNLIETRNCAAAARCV